MFSDIFFFTLFLLLFKRICVVNPKSILHSTGKASCRGTYLTGRDHKSKFSPRNLPPTTFTDIWDDMIWWYATTIITRMTDVLNREHVLKKTKNFRSILSKLKYYRNYRRQSNKHAIVETKDGVHISSCGCHSGLQGFTLPLYIALICND